MKTKGRVTFPIDVEAMDDSLRLMKDWGADAIRDCDGTVLPSNVNELGAKVYSTYFVTRGDNEHAKKHFDELQHFYVMSQRTIATDKTLEIELLKGFLTEQVQVDFVSDPKKYWEVIDRTTGEVVLNWSTDEKKGTVKINDAKKMHEYTVTFFVRAIWDSTQMYNYITNNWNREKEMPYDPRYPATNKYIFEHLKEWIVGHPDTDVVRFTTFFYHFALLFNSDRKEKFVDWFGYAQTCSPKAMDDFEIEYGYRLRPEDIVTEGSYNSHFKVPTKQYLDYMDFIGKFVAKNCKQLVEIVHAAGKEAMMFLGDTWIGTEPYGKYFESIGLDAIVGSVGSGITVRMLTDMPGVKYTEGRFLPYFFPDTFCEGGEPTKELNTIWIKARRSMLVKPLDRMGFGGYLGLAAKFPDFTQRVTDICDEFRNIHDTVKKHKIKTEIKVGVLNCWGKLRSWQAFMVAHELWYKQTYSYMEAFECLSGLPFEIKFLSFEDVLSGGLKDVDVLINVGKAYTAFSGGERWAEEQLVTTIREWVHGGGGLIGIGEPTAYSRGGKFFQLSEVLGVEKEKGFTLSTNKYNIEPQPHFITADNFEPIEYGDGTKDIYALENATVLDIDVSNSPNRKVNVGEVKMAANHFGKGRGVYLAGSKYSDQNTRIIRRAIMWAASKEQLAKKNFSSNTHTEYYNYDNAACLINNSTVEQSTVYYDAKGKETKVTLAPMEIKWL